MKSLIDTVTVYTNYKLIKTNQNLNFGSRFNALYCILSNIVTDWQGIHKQYQYQRISIMVIKIKALIVIASLDPINQRFLLNKNSEYKSIAWCTNVNEHTQASNYNQASGW